jgi:putative endonuclease
VTRNGRAGSSPARGTKANQGISFFIFMNFFVYILHSEKLDRFYVGTTTDIEQRFDEHNSGYYKDAYSTRGIPWKLFLTILCDNSAQAYQLEAFIKKMKSAAFIRRLKEQPDNIASIKDKINSGEIGTPKPRGRRT